MASGEEKVQMSKDRDPEHVLGWLTTSANYTVVTATAPKEHRPAATTPVKESVTLTESTSTPVAPREK